MEVNSISDIFHAGVGGMEAPSLQFHVGFGSELIPRGETKETFLLELCFSPRRAFSQELSRNTSRPEWPQSAPGQPTRFRGPHDETRPLHEKCGGGGGGGGGEAAVAWQHMATHAKS